jgi:hypothetical protein
MSIEIARYQFHSWARRGISANIVEKDDLGGGSATALERAEVPISVKLNGSGITKNFSLIGPGDIIGINRDMIVRTDPLNWITDYEPNYLAQVEFYDEEFLWRYTPASPQGEKLRPWVFLLVVKESEFERSSRRVPLPTITLKTKDVFPPQNETWLWAHVHSNADIPDSELSDYEKFLLSLNKTVNDDPDQIFCRLMSPRKLDPETAYYAFLIPSFETGRLAGLEEKTDGINAQLASWDANGAKGEMPVYFEWFFRTGTNVDFEALVKLLVPRPMDPRVGIRDMDTSRPGFVRAGDTTQEIPGTSPLIIGLEGALLAPTSIPTVFPNPSGARDFQVELQKVVNLPATIAANMTEDPIVSVPFYGQNHAKKSATEVVLLDTTKTAWVHDANRDPRTRVASGFGTLVVQKNQESYMRKAWQQVTTIIEANKKIRAARLMMSVALQYTKMTFSTLKPDELFSISHPVLKKVKGSPLTLYRLVRESRLPGAVFSGTFRRIARPKGALVRKLTAQTSLDVTRMVNRLNSGEISAAPPRGIPGGMFTTKDISGKILPNALPGWLTWIVKHLWLSLLVLLVLLLVAAMAIGGVMAFVAAAALFGVAYRVLAKIGANVSASEGILDPKAELESIARIGEQSAFTLTLSDEKEPPPPTPGDTRGDTVEAKNFRTGLTDMTKRLAFRPVVAERKAFDIAAATSKLSRAIDPRVTFPYRLSSLVKFPSYISLGEPEKIFPAMAYPDFDDPMYKKLADISSELLLPNLNLVPQNTISLLRTNQKFIEAYFIGLNHEMGRELLWREYPTDQRGSYFRQFWDVKGVIRPAEDLSEAELTEKYKDIEPIDTWTSTSLLGKHNKQEPQGDAEQLVLVVRGDLLKRYPNTLIFAQKAIPDPMGGEDPVVDLNLDDTEFAKNVRFPLYKAEISPDIKFFGFDLTIEQARGTAPTPGFSDTLGWFFILQEIPGEPRFGMDIDLNVSGGTFTWDDLAWTCFGGTPPAFITAGNHPSPEPSDNHPDIWGTDSAHMASILFQKPAMIAVHAKEMLESI